MFRLIFVHNRKILLRHRIAKCLEKNVKNQIFYIKILILNLSVNSMMSLHYAIKKYKTMYLNMDKTIFLHSSVF